MMASLGKPPAGRSIRRERHHGPVSRWLTDPVPYLDGRLVGGRTGLAEKAVEDDVTSLLVRLGCV